MAIGCILDYHGALRWVEENADRVASLENLEEVHTFCCAQLTPLHMAVIAQNETMLEALLQQGASSTELFTFLLWHGWKEDEAGFLAFFERFRASFRVEHLEDLMRLGKDQLIEQLLLKGIELSQMGTRPVRLALRLGKPALVNRFVSYGGLVPETAYVEAAGSLECLHWICGNTTGCDVNMQGKQGDTALIRLCRNNYPTLPEAEQEEAIALVLEQGALPNLATVEGYTALMYVSASGKKRLVEKLLAHGAHVGLRDQQGRNALVLARRKGHEEILTLLRHALSA